jgi:5'-deoxynucleotidase YfbR-like HD superfamily hydrolase
MMDHADDLVTDRLEMSGRVHRYACWPMISQQSVGEHSWQVYRVYCAIFGIPSAEIAFVIFAHDAEELIVGDSPFPTKRDNPEFKAASEKVEVRARQRLKIELPELSDEDKARVKVCDLLEMMCHGMTDREMGNLLAAPVVTRTERAAQELARAKLPERERARVSEFVYDEWRRHEHVLFNGDPSMSYNYERRSHCV